MPSCGAIRRPAGSAAGARAALGAFVFPALFAAPVASTAPEAGAAVRAWFEGETDSALGALAQAPPSRERDLNRAVVLLYAGKAAEAEPILRATIERDPRWLPAVRWLARAQRELRRPEAADTVRALLKLPGATGRDHFWAAGFFAEHKDLERARDGYRRALAEEDDLYLAWSALADVEAALGDSTAAGAARDKATKLHPGGPGGPLPLPPPLPEGPLSYRARYLFLSLATLTLVETRPVDARGTSPTVLTLEAKSSGVNFVFRINTRFQSFLGADGALLGYRSRSNDSATAPQLSAADLDASAGVMRVRRARDGLFSYEVLPLPAEGRGCDGVSMLEAARAVARNGGALSILRLVDATWKGTPVRAARVERIAWRHQAVDTVLVEISLSSRSAAGVAGVLQLWISADDRALPYRARMALGFGSVTLELQRASTDEED